MTEVVLLRIAIAVLIGASVFLVVAARRFAKHDKQTQIEKLVYVKAREKLENGAPIYERQQVNLSLHKGGA